jgi:hypothetical protein
MTIQISTGRQGAEVFVGRVRPAREADLRICTDRQPLPNTSPVQSGAISYERTFDQANLSVAGRLPIVHGLNTYPSGVTIWNQSGEQIMPDRIEVLSLTTISIDLQSFAPIPGLWRISVAP